MSSMQETENKKLNEIYMITDKEGLPLLMRNKHNFNDGEFPPQVGEVLMCLFARPLYAMSHIAERGGPQGYCFSLESQKELDALKELLTAEGVTRIHINPCLIKNEPHDRIFALLDIDKSGDLEKLASMLSDTEKCPVCHDEQKIVDNLGGARINSEILHL